MGQKQKSRLSRRMSALAPKADIGSDMAHVYFVPTAVVTTSARPQGRCSVVVELRVRDMDAFCTETCTSFSVTQEEGGSMRYVTIGGALALGLAVLSASVMLVPVAAQQPTFQRKILINRHGRR